MKSCYPQRYQELIESRPNLGLPLEGLRVLREPYRRKQRGSRSIRIHWRSESRTTGVRLPVKAVARESQLHTVYETGEIIVGRSTCAQRLSLAPLLRYINLNGLIFFPFSGNTRLLSSRKPARMPKKPLSIWTLAMINPGRRPVIVVSPSWTKMRTPHQLPATWMAHRLLDPGS